VTGDAFQQLSTDEVDDLMSADDYLMMDMSDTLFSSLTPPVFNTPRDLCTYSVSL